MDTTQLLQLLAGGPDVLISGVTLALITAVIVGNLKPIVRPLVARLRGQWGVGATSGVSPIFGKPDEDPWGLLSILVGVGLVALVATSSRAPGWLAGDPAMVVIYGTVVGIVAMLGRDALQLLRSAPPTE
ncbi:MAG: hypothetical protein AB7G21_09995 [Dehalococcoidia bacterium]